MRRSLVVASALLFAVTVGLVAQQPAADPLKAASDAIGVGSLKSLRFSGFGANFTVGQSPSPTDPWPRVAIKSYEATYDFEAEGMKVDVTREQGPVPPRGGGAPFVGEQRAIQVVRGTFAWDEPIPAPAAGGRRGGGPPPAPAAEAGRVTLQQALALAGVPPPAPPPVTPQPGAVVDRMVQYYLSPHGFLKAAVANKATTKKVGTSTEATFTLPNKVRLTGVINSRNEVEKVTALIDNPVLGDMAVEATYSNYQKFDEGVMFPLRIVQTTGGFPSFDLWVSAVTVNPEASTFQDPRNAANTTEAVDLTVPAEVRRATIPAPMVTAREIGKGIQYLTGGSHHSVAIEMRDHVILVEAPQNEARALAVVAKVKELFPMKPIRFVVNTHHHFDHSGGLRTLVAEGATVVTHQIDATFYKKAWAGPRTINPDKLSAAKKTPVFRTYTDKLVLADTPRTAAGRTVEIYRIAGSPHADGFAMVYLPAEKLLIEADAYTPPAPPAAAPAAGAGGGRGAAAAGGGGRGAAAAGGARGAAAGARGGAPATPPPPNPATVNLYENVQKLKLDVAQIAPLHGARLATLDDLKQAAMPAPPAPSAGATQ